MLQANLEEYFKLKRAIKEINADIRSAKKSNELAEDIEMLAKKLKEARAHLSADPVIVDLKEDVDKLKERFNLLKEIIKQELIEKGEDKVEYDGRIISIVKVMKEGKEKGGKKKKGGWDKTSIEIDEDVKVQ